MEWFLNNLNSIIAGIIASLIAVSLQTFTKVFSSIITSVLTKKYYYRRLFKLNELEQTYVISGSIPQRRDKDLALLMGPDASAAINIKHVVESIYPKMVVKHTYSNNQDIGLIDENIIAVGGPVFNKVTDFFMKQISNIILFNENDDLIVKDNIYSKNKDLMLDYGVICRIDNPVSPSKKAIIISGCGSNGVLAASQLLNTSNRFGYLKKEFKSKRGFINRLLNKDFIVIISTKIVANEVADVHILNVLTTKD